MSLTTNVQQSLQHLSRSISSSPLFQRARSNPLISSASAVAATVVAVALRRNYLKYLSIGPGGLPYNVFGWAIATFIFRPLTFGIDVTSTGPYENSDDPSYLPEGFPPPRVGERPEIAPFPVPHRQLTQLPSAAIKKELEDRVTRIMAQAKEKADVRIAQSGLELHTESMFRPLGADPTNSAGFATRGTKGEFAHVHATGDHSLHMILSAKDCKKVLEAGWGQRHGFDGHRVVKTVFGLGLPMSYIMVYAPRSQGDIEVICQLLKAAVEYNTGVKLD